MTAPGLELLRYYVTGDAAALATARQRGRYCGADRCLRCRGRAVLAAIELAREPDRFAAVAADWAMTVGELSHAVSIGMLLPPEPVAPGIEVCR